jgi:hypothetical protein
MISYAESEAYLAEAWKELVCQTFRLADESVWFSSEPASVNPRSPFAEAIERNLRAAKGIISIQSPVSRHRPWILWEAGMARALEKSLYVVVFEQSGVTVDDSIFRNLDTPLDAFSQYLGTDLRQIEERMIKTLASDLQRLPDRDRLIDALRKYKRQLKKWERYWVKKTTNLEERIRLVFETAERQILEREGTISDDVLVEGDRNSMAMFDLPNVGKMRWEDLRIHLKSVKLPWAGSATLWANNLGRALQHALKVQPGEDPKGLPLYFHTLRSRSYRPSISAQTVVGSQTSFDISFTCVPPVLNARPKGNVGTLLDYLDFCRMMRWGIFGDAELAAFFRNPDRVQKAVWHDFYPVARIQERQREEYMREFLERLYAVRAEFLNRGVQKDSIELTAPAGDEEILEAIRDRYYRAIDQIDPTREGIMPKPLPDIKVFQKVYTELFCMCNDLYLFVNSALGRELEALPKLDGQG